MTDTRTRKALLLGLVGIFFVQTWMVYTDPIGREAPPLSAEASRGQALWHSNNCQSCHQIYGFGGFLGPDLTNAAGRLTDERLTAVLTDGTEIMPAFHMDAEERANLLTFLVEVDLTGQGQARAAEIVPPRTLLADLFRGSATPEDPLLPQEEQGLTLLLDKNCIDCHLPNAGSAYRSPDMTLMTTRLGADGVATILTTGVPGKAMPAFALTTAELGAVSAALTRLERHGDQIRTGFEAAADAASGSLLDLPWFEYPRLTETDESADDTPTPTDP